MNKGFVIEKQYDSTELSFLLNGTFLDYKKNIKFQQLSTINKFITSILTNFFKILQK